MRLGTFSRGKTAYMDQKMLPSAEFVICLGHMCGPVTQKNVLFNDIQYPGEPFDPIGRSRLFFIVFLCAADNEKTV